MEMWIDLHSSAKVGIKWPVVKLSSSKVIRFIMHCGHFAPLCLRDSSPIVLYFHAKSHLMEVDLHSELEVPFQGPGVTSSASLAYTLFLNPPVFSLANTNTSSPAPHCDLLKTL